MKIWKRKTKSNTQPSSSSSSVAVGIGGPDDTVVTDTVNPRRPDSFNNNNTKDTKSTTNDKDTSHHDKADTDTNTQRFLDTVTNQCCANNAVDATDDNNNDGDELDINLEEELAKLDIDKDFNLSILARYSNDDDNDNDKSRTDPLNLLNHPNNNNNDHDEEDDGTHDDMGSHDDTHTTVSDDNDAVLVHRQPNKDCSNPRYATLQLNRMEVFSNLYKPTRTETATLKELATQLGMASSGMTSTTSTGGGTGSSTQALLLSKLLNRTLDREIGYSILLKRGRVILQQQENDTPPQERILLLLTHGFVLAYPDAVAANGTSTTTATSSILTMFTFTSKPKYDHVYLYNDIGWVKDLWQLDGVKDLYRFSLQTPDQQPQQHQKQRGELHLACHSAKEKQEWLAAFEIVLLKNRTVVQQKSMSPEERDARIVGWQHELLQTSLYTAAVTGQAFFSPHHIERCNTLDEYNGMAPLHYAALHNQVHIIQHLCDACGANVELKDVEGRTPMYYAERDNWVPAIHALREAGARDSAALEQELHGALIEEARELEQQQKEEAEREELLKGAAMRSGATRRWMDVAGAAIAGLDQEKLQPHDASNHDGAVGAVKGAAQKAHFHMRDGMNALNERGNKINQLSDKTNDLENNAGEYKDLAAQVRKKLEKQNKGLNFLNPFT